MSDSAQLRQIVRQRLLESISTKRRLLASTTVDEIATIAAVISDAYRNGAKVLLFGNGGSAADAQHLAAEFLGRFRLERQSLPAIALSDNSASVTAVGNDYGFEHVFARQIEGLGDRGDVALALSTSGTSENVVAGIEAANAKGLVTIALTGASGGRVKEVADYCVRVPATETARIQEAYMAISHVLCEIVEQELFADAYSVAE